MGLLSGMEKFGFGDGGFNILDTEPEVSKSPAVAEVQVAAEPVKLEKDFLIRKKVKCPVCDKEFEILQPTNTKLKRLEPDFDLRPNFEYIDTIKYDVISCNNCGYSAMTSQFMSIDSARIKLVKQEICANFTPERQPNLESYSYDFAIEKFKLALVNTIKKRGKMSEKAYCCLKLAWLRRAQLKELEAEGVSEATIQEAKAEYEGFYRQAYDGFMKAIETEVPPYCGMSSTIVEYMCAQMSFHYEKYDISAKLVARLITAPGTDKRMKEKCLDLKEQIMKKVKEQK